ncbi:MAG: hypothetical protein RR998_08470 [Oscillospiraceae bacterium]
MQENLCFWITGEYITKLARDFFYKEHREMPYIEKLLLLCMSGTDTPREILLGYGKDVLAGRCCFIGNTKDGSYALIEDTEHPELAAAYEREQMMRQRWGDNWPEEKRNAEIAMEAERLEREDAAASAMVSSASAMVSSFIQNERAEREHGPAYGWIAPDGTFYPVEWGNHQEWARRYFQEKRGCDLFELPLDERNTPGDVLAEKGWALLHNPGLGVPVITNAKRLTNAQRDFMFDYYTRRGIDTAAAGLYE